MCYIDGQKNKYSLINELGMWLFSSTLCHSIVARHLMCSNFKQTLCVEVVTITFKFGTLNCMRVGAPVDMNFSTTDAFSRMSFFILSLIASSSVAAHSVLVGGSGEYPL
jgi:hypothetical protein